jgi:hypothetical protein
MKAVLNREIQRDTFPAENDRILAIIYPQLYCPRCGSYEIGLRQLVRTSAVWGCKDCAALFTLDFPGRRRF